MIFLNFKKWVGNAPRSRRRVAQLIFKPYALHGSSVGHNGGSAVCLGLKVSFWESAWQPCSAAAESLAALGAG